MDQILPDIYILRYYYTPQNLKISWCLHLLKYPLLIFGSSIRSIFVRFSPSALLPSILRLILQILITTTLPEAADSCE